MQNQAKPIEKLSNITFNIFHFIPASFNNTSVNALVLSDGKFTAYLCVNNNIGMK